MLLKTHTQRLKKFAIFFAFIGLVALLVSPTYVTAADFPVGLEPKSIASADFNNDGNSDLVTTNRSAGTLSVLLGQGNGNFNAAANITTGGEPFSVAVGDFNGDGKSDLIVSNISSGSISLLLGDGTGGFGAPTSFRFGENPGPAAVGDFNGDGKADIAVADSGFNNGGLYVLLGTGTGSFGAATKFTAGLRPRDVVIGDFNADGKTDLAVANVGFGFNKVSVLLGVGDGSFSAPTQFAVGSSPIGLAVNDLNKDGKSDLVVLNTDSHNVSILLGDGSGNFGAATNFPVGVSFPLSVAIGDFNSDGKSDLAVGPNSGFPNTPGSIVIMLGDGVGNFTSRANFTVGGGPSTFAVGDFNRNGKTDLAVANSNSNSVSILLDNPPTVSINNVTVTEGDSGVVAANFTATLSSPSDKDVRISYAAVNGTTGTTASISDINIISGPLVIPAGSLTGNISVMVNGDRNFEPDETFFVNLTNPVNAFIANEQGQGTILNDDPQPSISIDDIPFSEGNSVARSINLNVNLSNASYQPITVSFNTSDGTAVAGSDYTAAVGTVTFEPFETTKLINIFVNGDTIGETDETFSVNLSNPINATLGRSQSVVTIINDDLIPLQFSQSAYSASESAGSAAFTVTRTGSSNSKLVAKVSLADVTTSAADYSTPGAVDASFDPGTGTNNNVNAIASQADGKIIIGGQFTTYKGIGRNHVARINPDGSLDTSFNPGAGADGPVQVAALQPDGKIIIAGHFFNYNNTPRRHIARLNSDGSLDTSFDAGTLPFGSIFTITVQPDGKLLFGGDFYHNNTPGSRVVRLNSDGSLDPTFSLGNGANSFVLATALQPDGKIIVAGDFTTYNNSSRNRIVRLNSDGFVDTSFTPGAGANDSIYAVALQADGRVVIGGMFTSYGGTARNRLARLNIFGSLDFSFNTGGTGPNLSVVAMATQPDGRLIIGGNFTTYNDISRPRIARLNMNGSLDTTFNPGLGANGQISEMVVQDNGKIVIGGEFNDYNNSYRGRIARVEGDMFVTWPAGDTSDKTVLLFINDDSIFEPSETLTLTLVPLVGGGATGANSTATLTIIDNETTLSAISGSGVYNGTITLTATLATSSSVLSGKAVTFEINGIPVGTATTDSNGLATLSGISLSNLNAGTYPNAVRARFAGDTGYSSSVGTGSLTISKATPVITWNNPANIVSGTALSGTQLNATANVPGTFQYTPPSGTVLDAGTHQLSTTFNPTDAVNYNSVTQNVQLTVTTTSSSLQLLLDESGDIPNQVAAIDSTLFLRDPFPVVNTDNLLNEEVDKNTRLIIFLTNLQLAPGEASSSVMVNLVDGNNQIFEVAAEDVRPVPLFNFAQVRFRLPDGLAPGTCAVKVKAHGQESNSGTIRIKG